MFRVLLKDRFSHPDIKKKKLPPCRPSNPHCHCGRWASCSVSPLFWPQQLSDLQFSWLPVMYRHSHQTSHPTGQCTIEQGPVQTTKAGLGPVRSWSCGHDCEKEQQTQTVNIDKKTNLWANCGLFTTSSDRGTQTFIWWQMSGHWNDHYSLSAGFLVSTDSSEEKWVAKRSTMMISR